jgi:hypothetical protein
LRDGDTGIGLPYAPGGRSAAAEGSFAVYRQSIKLKLRGKDRNFADTRTFRAQEGEYPEVVEGDQLRHAAPS